MLDPEDMEAQAKLHKAIADLFPLKKSGNVLININLPLNLEWFTKLTEHIDKELPAIGESEEDRQLTLSYNVSACLANFITIGVTTAQGNFKIN